MLQCDHSSNARVVGGVIAAAGVLSGLNDGIVTATCLSKVAACIGLCATVKHPVACRSPTTCPSAWATSQTKKDAAPSRAGPR